MFRYLFLLAALLLTLTPASAEEPVPLADRLCSLGTAAGTPYPAARFAAGEANCDRRKLTPNSPLVWARAPIDAAAHPPGELVLLADPVVFDSITLRVTYADGLVSERKYGPDAAVRNWLPGARFWVPIPDRLSAPVEIALGVERPQARDTLETLAIRSKSAMEHDRTIGIILCTGLAVIVLLPLIYNIAFYAALRERYILWHSGALIAGSIYVIFSSSIALEFLPQLSLEAHWRIALLGFVVAAMMAILFARSFFERGAISPWMRNALAWAPVVIALSGAFLAFGPAQTKLLAHTIYYASFAPVLGIMLLAATCAIVRGSRSAKFILASWLGIAAGGVNAILDGTGIAPAYAPNVELMYYAIAWEIFVTAIAVADRFLMLRRDRDREVRARMEFARLADTDILTGLRNRRRLEADWDEQGYTALAVVDLDRFKAINDEYGHEIGDKTLRAAAIALSGADEDRVCVYRWGGEEFVLGIHARTAEEAVLIAQRARQAVEDRVRVHVPEVIRPLTASAGLARSDNMDFDVAFRAADQALLAAKQSGRDRLWVADVDKAASAAADQVPDATAYVI